MGGWLLPDPGESGLTNAIPGSGNTSALPYSMDPWGGGFIWDLPPAFSLPTSIDPTDWWRLPPADPFAMFMPYMDPSIFNPPSWLPAPPTQAPPYNPGEGPSGYGPGGDPIYSVTTTAPSPSPAPPPSFSYPEPPIIPPAPPSMEPPSWLPSPPVQAPPMQEPVYTPPEGPPVFSVDVWAPPIPEIPQPPQVSGPPPVMEPLPGSTPQGPPPWSLPPAAPPLPPYQQPQPPQQPGPQPPSGRPQTPTPPIQIPQGQGAPMPVNPSSTIGGGAPYQSQFQQQPYSPMGLPSLAEYIGRMIRGGI